MKTANTLKEQNERSKLHDEFMKTTTKPLHTQGEWNVCSGLILPNDLCIHSFGKLIARMPLDRECFTPNEKAEREANAQRIVKAVNMHDIFVTELAKLFHGRYANLDAAKKLVKIYDKIEQLLKQAEQK